MPPQIMALGELLVEVMRPGVDQPLSRPGQFLGPYPSGAPAIFIDAAARLGASTGFIGVVGAAADSADAKADPFGQCVLDRLRDDGVDTTHVRVAPGYTTGTAFVAYRSDGSRTFCFHLPHSAAALLAPDDVEPAYLSGVQFLHVTGSALSISESARQACYKAVRLCKTAGGRVSFDPNLRPELIEHRGNEAIDQIRQICQPVLDRCDLLLPSGPEAAMLAGSPTGDTTADQAAETACLTLVERGIPIVALKRGAQGSTVYAATQRHSAVQRLDAPPLSVAEIDPTGAGDCYGAAFVVGLLEGMDLAAAARFANVVGALAVTVQGPMEGAPRRADVLAHL
jgi:sugar/nucleoside kinase (ribokinase family)